MDHDCPSDLIDYLVFRFRSFKVRIFDFDGNVKTNLVSRDMLR